MRLESIALPLVTAVLISACDADVSVELADAIATDLRRDGQWPVSSVTCPSTAGAAERFECVVTFADGTLAPVSVQERDHVLRWKLEVVHSHVVHDSLRSADATRVDCGARTVLVVSATERLRCRVERRGSRVTVVVRWGGQSWVAEPTEDGA